MKLKTVQIETGNGPVTINEDDFDEKTDRLVGAPKAKAAPKAAPKAEAGITPEDIDNMRTKSIKEILAAHGIEDPKGKLPELREMAKRVVFVAL